MLERINTAVSEGYPLVCFSRKEFENNKSLVYNHPYYLTHYYYKFSDVALVGICLRKEKK